jgi:hypothetical protein
MQRIVRLERARDVKPLAAPRAQAQGHEVAAEASGIYSEEAQFREELGFFVRMGKTSLFICGAAPITPLGAVRPLAGSRRSSPLAALPQKLGVTHPHARALVFV